MIDVSVVFFSYNRTGYLMESLMRFWKKCKYPLNRIEIIISDDCSKEKYHEALHYIAAVFNAKLLISDTNRGMGASFNAGIRAAQGEYILHLQDDWGLMDHDDNFIQKSIDIIQSSKYLSHDNRDIALVRLSMLGNEITKFGGDIKNRMYGSINACDLSNDYYLYSDNPHLKLKRFHEEFGYYKEASTCEEVEHDMCRRFNSQNEWRAMWLGEYFEHIGQFSTMRGRCWASAPKINMHFNPNKGMT